MARPSNLTADDFKFVEAHEKTCEICDTCRGVWCVEILAHLENRRPAGPCGCGRPLFVVRDASGRRIGVTHYGEDEWHHLSFWSGRGPDQIAAAMDENQR